MKRLILSLLLIGTIFILGTFATNQIKTFLNNATAILSGINTETIEDEVRTYIHTNILTNNTLPETADIILTKERINTDTRMDIIARIDSLETCGSGGCMIIILLQDEEGNFNPIPFAYTVKEIAVESTVTNNMHDLRVNNDSKSILKWDGERYTLNSF